MYTLHKPFFGTLDGDGKKLSNVYVNYDGGYWALFDYIVRLYDLRVGNLALTGQSVYAVNYVAIGKVYGCCGSDRHVAIDKYLLKVDGAVQTDGMTVICMSSPATSR